MRVAARRGRRHRQFRRRASRPPRGDCRRARAREALRQAGGRADLRAASAAASSGPTEPLFRLTDERDKLRLLAATGLDGAIVLTFDAALAGLDGGGFRRLASWSSRFGITGAAIGFDFHFGKKRAGSPDFLAAEGAGIGFAVDIVPPFERRRPAGSSGPIRDRARGRARSTEAAELLGYPWFVTGEVVHGDKRGRELGFPTANLRLDPACGLRHGIYAVRVGVGGTRATTASQASAAGRCSTSARAARGLPVRFFRRPLRPAHRRRLHRLDPARAEVRHGRGARARA